MAKKKKSDTIENIELCPGVELGSTFFEKKENRLLTLLLKGVIVYLLSMGSIGFYLSALDVEYNEVLCHLVIGIMAILCAFLYYRLWVENTGYLLLFAMFGFLVYTFRTYINSGFYALVNMTVDEAAQYFNVDIQKLYTEQIENRYVTVTFVCLFIGVVLDILLNVYISRRMQYVNSLFTIMSLNLIPLYMTAEPDTFYVIMMLAGLAMAYVFKSSKHHSPQIYVRRDNDVFAEKGGKKKKYISYVYDIKALVQAGVGAVLVTVCVVIIVSAFKPKESFNTGYEGNKYKNLTMSAVSTFLIDGWSGFYRDQDNVGGMHGGKLGDVSTVRLDYQTDLVVQLTPYSYDAVYLKSFTGIEYVPYSNQWTSMENLAIYDTSQTPEADALKNAYESGAKGTSKAVMKINPVGVGSSVYLPYYTQDISFDDPYYNAIYYPRTDENETVIILADYMDGMAFTEMDLYVSPENEEAIKEIVSQIEWGSSDEEKVYQLREYFQNNIPYTVRPGKTPKNEDFVNYFLMDNKKGYCAHYATAATLIFRYLGIPARYVEGYMISYNQILEGELVEGAEYSDYYDGYSELGETALVEVNVTDADAHAWVEIYITGKGWCPVDVTPAGEEEEVEDFWEMFDEAMNSSDTGGATINANIVNFKISNDLIKKICFGVVGIICGIAGIIFSIKCAKIIVIYIRYLNAGINDRLIIKYSAYCKKIKRKDKNFKEKINYNEQIEYLGNVYGKAEDVNNIISILEKAGFSSATISQTEYTYVVKWLPKYNRKAVNAENAS